MNQQLTDFQKEKILKDYQVKVEELKARAISVYLKASQKLEEVEIQRKLKDLRN